MLDLLQVPVQETETVMEQAEKFTKKEKRLALIMGYLSSAVVELEAEQVIGNIRGGRPCFPRVRPFRMARTQCSYRLADFSDRPGRS